MNTRLVANAVALATSWGAFVVTILEQANEMLGALSAISGTLLTVVFTYTNLKMKLIEIRAKKAEAKRKELENYFYEKEENTKYVTNKKRDKNDE